MAYMSHCIYYSLLKAKMTSTKQEEVILQTKHASSRKVEQESDLNGTNKIVEVKFNNQKIIINNRIIQKGERYFLSCQSCFWCASCYYLLILSMSHRHVSNTITAKCPACDTVGKIESMPIFRDEQYTFEHHKSYGIVLEFFPAQK